MAKKPTSQRQIDANRRNAQGSTGPRSAAGKDRSAQNSGRHFAYSDRFHPIVGGPFAEDPEAFLHEAEQIASDFRLSGPALEALADRAAALIMKIRRFDRLEAAVFDAEVLPNPDLLPLMEEQERNERLAEQLSLLAGLLNVDAAGTEAGLDLLDWETIAQHVKATHAPTWTLAGVWDRACRPSGKEDWQRAAMTLMEGLWPHVADQLAEATAMCRSAVVSAEMLRQFHAAKVADKLITRAGDLERPRAHLMRQLTQTLDQIRATLAIRELASTGEPGADNG